MLCPTTVLAEQHYQNFASRLEGFPVRVEMLSRFVSPKRRKVVLEAVARGEVDILIGTHRILSSDVTIPNIGLLILDEEQRFGVKHKERLKAFKKNIDALTLTATPIPRTLQLSLSGVRGLSVIETPPPERKAVETALVEREPGFLREVLRRELERQGQVFWVSNRVQGLEEVTAFVKTLAPGAKVGMFPCSRISPRRMERTHPVSLHPFASSVSPWWWPSWSWCWVVSGLCMGGIYTRRKGKSEAVSRAIAEQYLPLGPDSPVPATLAGAILAIADKADTLAGCFGLDMAPTGAADPYALRRASLGICRIVIEHGLHLNLMELFQSAIDGYGDIKFKVDRTRALARLLDFFGQRLRAYFTGRGYDTLVVEAAIGASFDDVAALASRIDALAAFAARSDFDQAVLTFKRAANIIRKQGASAGQPLTGVVKAELLVEQAEKDLATACADVFPRFDELFEAGDYAAVLDLLHGGNGADGPPSGPVAGLHPGDEMAHGEQGDGERREKQEGQPPFQVEQIAVDAKERDHQPDDGRTRIRQEVFQGVHVADDHGHGLRQGHRHRHRQPAPHLVV